MTMYLPNNNSFHYWWFPKNKKGSSIWHKHTQPHPPLYIPSPPPAPIPILFIYLPPNSITHTINYFNFLNACGATQWSTQCKISKYHASQSPSPNLAIRSLQALYSLCWLGQCLAHEALRAGRWSTTSSSDCFCYFVLFYLILFVVCVHVCVFFE